MKALHEIHSGDFVTFVTYPRPNADTDELVARKVRKDFIALRKLIAVSFKYTKPIIEWKNNDKTIISVASQGNNSISPKLKFWFTHRGQRSFLALETLVFVDALTAQEHEIQYTDVSKLIIPSQHFETINAEWEAAGITI